MVGGSSECGRAADKREGLIQLRGEASQLCVTGGKLSASLWHQKRGKECSGQRKWPTHACGGDTAGALAEVHVWADGFQDERKLIYLGNCINRTRCHYFCALGEIIVRPRVLRDVTGCSDVLCNLERQARGRITGFSRTQKRERIINIVNLAFRVMIL